MKVLIATYGSRGDVQPYIALGQGLKAAGHQVTLATSVRFRDFVESHGLNHGALSDDLLSIIDTDQGKELLEKTTNFYEVVKQNFKLAKQVRPLQVALMREGWQVAHEFSPDFIIYHPKMGSAAHSAEKLGVRCALATPIPMFVPTSERPFPVLPDWKLGGWYNRLGYRLIALMSRMFLGRYIRDFRNEIGLPPMEKFDLLRMGDGAPIPTLHAFSEVVLPHPQDWPDNAYTTGYWFLEHDEEWCPPDDLQAFLEGGSPPVYVGFGSMTGRNPKQLAELVVAALVKAQVRGIIATGWGGLKTEELPETIFRLEGAPHDWLFPLVAAVVHHGGAGTTAAGLRAGKPSVIVPFFGDQPFWGNQVHSLGAGPVPVARKKITVDKLADAIKAAVSDTRMKERAAEIGNQIRNEDGVKQAVGIIESLIK